MLTLSEGKWSASVDADHLYVDGGYCGEGCSARDGGDVQPNMAATKQTGQGGSGRCLLRAGRRREAAKDGCNLNKRDEAGRGEIAPRGTEEDNPAARVRRLGQRGAILQRGCSAWYEGGQACGVAALLGTKGCFA